MSVFTILKWVFILAAIGAIVQYISSFKHKKEYDLALKSGNKSDCITKGRVYYRSLFKWQLKAKKITDIETTINNDLSQFNIL